VDRLPLYKDILCLSYASKSRAEPVRILQDPALAGHLPDMAPYVHFSATLFIPGQSEDIAIGCDPALSFDATGLAGVFTARGQVMRPHARSSVRLRVRLCAPVRVPAAQRTR
jgi:hypothetical protein